MEKQVVDARIDGFQPADRGRVAVCVEIGSRREDGSCVSTMFGKCALCLGLIEITPRDALSRRNRWCSECRGLVQFTKRMERKYVAKSQMGNRAAERGRTDQAEQRRTL